MTQEVEEAVDQPGQAACNGYQGGTKLAKAQYRRTACEEGYRWKPRPLADRDVAREGRPQKLSHRLRGL